MSSSVLQTRRLSFPASSYSFSFNPRARAQARGLKLNEYELAGKDSRLVCKTEEDIFRALDLDYIPPEMREDTGELDAAEKHAVPKLVEVDDIQGVFHN